MGSQPEKKKMDLSNRYVLSNQIQDRVRVALASDLSDLMELTLDSQATPEEKKSLRVRQRWALQAFRDMNGSTESVSLLVAANTGNGPLDDGDGLTDQELKNQVGKAVAILAGVELRVPEETLPA